MIKQQKGFTFIEVAVAMTIVAGLTTIAYPAYDEYTIRAQVSEGYELSSNYKTAIAEYYSMHGTFPNSLADISSGSNVGGYVKGSNIEADGVIKMTYGNNSNKKIHDGFITLTPSATADGNIAWTCSYDGVKVVKKYVPVSCKNEGINAGVGGTNGSGAGGSGAGSGSGTGGIGGGTGTGSGGISGGTGLENESELESENENEVELEDEQEIEDNCSSGGSVDDDCSPEVEDEHDNEIQDEIDSKTQELNEKIAERDAKIASISATPGTAKYQQKYNEIMTEYTQELASIQAEIDALRAQL